MPPRRTRRRARRRSSARPIVLLVAAAVVLGILVGGLTQVSRAVGGLPHQLRSLPGGAGHRGRGSVQRDRGHRTQGPGRPAVADPPGAAGGTGQRRATDEPRVGPGRDRRRRDAARPGGDPVRRRLRRPGRGRDPAACRGLRIPRHAADCTGQCADAGHHRRPHERGAGAVRDAGHQPHRRGRRAPHAFGRALPIGAAVARRRRRTRDASPLGLGDRPPGLAGRERGRSGRSPGHVPHPGRDALRGPAHRAA